MTRFKLVDGVMVEDPEGPYMFVMEHKTVLTTLQTQVAAIQKYVEAVDNYISGVE